ncbi:gas vesicle protein [Pseudomonas sp. MM213]|uniref:gas vesicle accessory protein GvpU n=1 Tax=Pseudomonas sp. MM213 TaxID=2866807 RepID=UPI001CF1A69E|nr:gas vesicle accessory protein GvpU [Pseudomonas sp. MM213]UCP10235.1 gas vesicle protein [Pseudomonas sp. MM213]
MSDVLSSENSEEAEAAVPSDSDFFNDATSVKQQWEGRQTDWLLQWLCKFVNSNSLEIGVTLTLGGSFVTGTLISHQKYFEQLSSDFSNPFAGSGEEAQEQIRSLILGFNPPVIAGEESPPVQYVHLKNAHMYMGANDRLPTNGALWRGKISAVDGFILGSLGKAK